MFEDDSNWYKPRRQKDSSLSEKILLNRVTGEVVEKPIETIARCLKQEAGMDVSVEELKRQRAVSSCPGTNPQALSSETPRSKSMGQVTEKREGVADYRQVAHYMVELSSEHYRDWYLDPRNSILFALWHSVNEYGVITLFLQKRFSGKQNGPSREYATALFLSTLFLPFFAPVYESVMRWSFGSKSVMVNGYVLPSSSVSRNSCGDRTR
jgi:hypothetical protein